MALPPARPDSTCLVTGASSGIGAELARALAARGLGVTLVARRATRLADLAAELVAAHDVRAEVVPADLSDVGSRRELLAEIDRRGLTVAVLVNNAGLSTYGRVHVGEPERDLDMVRVDVEAVVHLTSAFLPGMVDRGEGAVCNVASMAAFQPLPGQAGYGGAKAFVLSYTQALDAELRGSGVTATALCPGPVRTEFAETAGFDPDEAEGSLPEVMWVSATAVARAGVEGMAKGRVVVVPGAANRAVSVVAQHTPRSLLLRMVGRRHPAMRED